MTAESFVSGADRTVGATNAHLIRMLRLMPGVAAAVEKLAAKGDVFRIVVSEENAHLVVENAKGVIETTLRERGRFVENVKLERVPAGYAEALAQVAIQAALTEISEKLDAVIQRVDHVAELINETHRGALKGAIAGLSAEMRAKKPSAIRVARAQINPKIGDVIGLMKVHIGDMPAAETGWGDGWDANWGVRAESAHKAVCCDLGLVLEGLKAVIESYLLLGEYESASEIFDRFSRELADAGLETARVRSRLLPWNAERPPEAPFAVAIASLSAVSGRLAALHQNPSPLVEMVVSSSELLAEAQVPL